MKFLKTKASTPQPTPKPGRKAVAEFVLADVRERVESGRRKYGTLLMTGNGRNALWDAYQEVIDLTMYLRQELLEREDRPTVVCLCGSTRFYEAFQEANYRLTMEGKIVLSVGFYGGSVHGQNVGVTAEQKANLDQLHLRKIDIADEVCVLNVNGYIGESTDNEIRYALHHKKPVSYLVEPTFDVLYKYEPSLAYLHLGRDPEIAKYWEGKIQDWEQQWSNWRRENGYGVYGNNE